MAWTLALLLGSLGGCTQLISRLGAGPSGPRGPPTPCGRFSSKRLHGTSPLGVYSGVPRGQDPVCKPVNKPLPVLLHYTPFDQSKSQDQAQSQCRAGLHKGMDMGGEPESLGSLMLQSTPLFCEYYLKV